MPARKMLEKWLRELKEIGGAYTSLDLNTGRGKRAGSIGKLFRRKVSADEAREFNRIYLQAMWTELIFGGKSDVAAYAAEIIYYLRYQGRVDGSDGKLADLVYACIVCGMEKQGREYSERLKKWLHEDQFSGENTYFNQEKRHLQKKILSVWYTAPDEEIQALLDQEAECGICHFCTNVVCKELESMRIVFLVRQGKIDEARERLMRSLELQPSDEFMRAIRHMVFEDR